MTYFSVGYMENLKIEKITFDTRVDNDLKILAMNYRPKEPYAYLLGRFKLPLAYVYELIHDATAQSADFRVDPNTNYFVKAYSLKRAMLPDICLDLLSWFHAHSIDYPSSHLDIPGQKRFRKIYRPSFATIINYNTLEMKCFDVENDEVIIIPHEVRSIPQEIRMKI